MDATHYEKIADKLMQFRGKLPDVITLKSNDARMMVELLKNSLDSVLSDIDAYAAVDEEGWIR